MSTAVKSNNPIVREINRNFLIRYKFQDNPKTFLVGGGQYHNIVGRELANKHFDRALSSQEDRVTIKVRGHLKIDFVSK